MIVNKVKGTRNPADVLTKFLDTGEASKKCLIGMVDLTQQGLDRHVSQANIKSVGSISSSNQKVYSAGWTKRHTWKPMQSAKLIIRQYLSSVSRNRSGGVLPHNRIQVGNADEYHRK